MHMNYFLIFLSSFSQDDIEQKESFNVDFEKLAGDQSKLSTLHESCHEKTCFLSSTARSAKELL